MTIDEVIFISYQAISFTWDVVPTEIEDIYEIDLIMEFETNVPVPVVTVEVPDTMPELIGNETYNFYATLTNHGLITANDVELNLPIDCKYEFFTNYVTADLHAQQAIQVPVVMQVRQDTIGIPTNTPCDVCNDIIWVRYWYECVNGIWRQGGTLITYQGRVCPGPGEPWNPQGVDGCAECPPPSSNGIPLSPTNSSSICEFCLEEVLGAALGCGPPPVAAVGCAYSLVTSGVSSLPGCYRGPPGCIYGIGEVLYCLYESNNSEFQEGNTDLQKSLGNSYSPIIIQAADDIQEAIIAYEAQEAWMNEFFGSLATNDNITEIASAVGSFTDNELPISAADSIQIKAQLSGFDIDESELDNFINRWNDTQVAWGDGVYAPNGMHPNIINRDSLESYVVQIQMVHDYALERGYQSIEEMFYESIEIIRTQTESEGEGVCASVTINISQELTMTREAFEGTLGVVNGHPTDMMDSLSLNLEILDPGGVLSNDLFQIELIGLNQLTEIDGSGQLNAQAEGTATILFIPEPAAAPTVPVNYSFGGSISYFDPYSESMVTVPLLPVTLQVNPSPDLYLHYFMQRDIYGDDALTDAIEPIIPAELAVMVENNGFGTAMGVTIESSQPEIIENESGLAIEFNLIGSNLQGQPANMGLTYIDFGDIDPMSAKIGQWYFTSTLLGHFVNYETNLVHLSSYGNPDLSLVSGAELHELIHTVSVYNADDGIDDFLVNEIQDANETPDAIYLSQGNLIYDVFEAQNGFFTVGIILN